MVTSRLITLSFCRASALFVVFGCWLLPAAQADAPTILAPAIIHIERGDWKQSAFADLWRAAVVRSPDIRFVLDKLGATDDSRACMIEAIADAAKTPGFGPSYPDAPPNADISGLANILYPTTEPSFGRKKRVLNQSELIALYQMIRNSQNKLLQDFLNYLSLDTAVSASAKTELLELVGPVALARLDKDIASHGCSCPLKVGEPWPEQTMDFGGARTRRSGSD